VFHLLMGKESDLFLWDMPRFAANLSISKSFPVLGPISIRQGNRIFIQPASPVGNRGPSRREGACS
jgi:hypothetical protein